MLGVDPHVLGKSFNILACAYWICHYDNETVHHHLTYLVHGLLLKSLITQDKMKIKIYGRIT